MAQEFVALKACLEVSFKRLSLKVEGLGDIGAQIWSPSGYSALYWSAAYVVGAGK